MKRLWVALVLIMITLGINAYVFFTMDNLYEYFVAETDTIIEAIDNGNMEKAEETAQKLVKEWEEQSKSINMHVSHKSTHDIEAKFVALKEYITNDGQGDAYTFAEQIKYDLLLLRESEIPYLYNLL